MKELNNINKSFNDFSEYLEDKILKHQPSQSGMSHCCGAPVVDDYELCSDCKEHCDRIIEDDIDEDTKDEYNRKNY